jgi:hypothetical protein
MIQELWCAVFCVSPAHSCCFVKAAASDKRPVTRTYCWLRNIVILMSIITPPYLHVGCSTDRSPRPHFCTSLWQRGRLFLEIVWRKLWTSSGPWMYLAFSGCLAYCKVRRLSVNWESLHIVMLSNCRLHYGHELHPVGRAPYMRTYILSAREINSRRQERVQS